MNLRTQEMSDPITGYISIFSPSDWEELDGIINNIMDDANIFETPKRGDSRNEYVDLSVARLIVRKDACSTIVNAPYSLKILNLLSRSNFVNLIEQKTKFKKLNILRMQLNSMKKDSFVGLHTDSENDPAYEITVIIRTNSAYSGGELCLYGNGQQIVIQPNHSIFLMDSSVEHEVKVVTEGYRNSLVVVLGRITSSQVS